MALGGDESTATVDWHLQVTWIHGVTKWSLRPEENGHHCADTIFKIIFLNEWYHYLMKISVKFVYKVSLNNKSVPDQVILTHWPLGYWNEILNKWVLSWFSNWWLMNLLWNWPQLIFTESHWWEVNIGSGNGLVPPGTKPLPEPILTRSMSPYDITRPQSVTTKSIQLHCDTDSMDGYTVLSSYIIFCTNLRQWELEIPSVPIANMVLIGWIAGT